MSALGKYSSEAIPNNDCINRLYRFRHLSGAMQGSGPLPKLAVIPQKCTPRDQRVEIR
jgi:hypothetical protein